MRGGLRRARSCFLPPRALRCSGRVGPAPDRLCSAATPCLFGLRGHCPRPVLPVVHTRHPGLRDECRANVRAGFASTSLHPPAATGKPAARKTSSGRWRARCGAAGRVPRTNLNRVGRRCLQGRHGKLGRQLRVPVLVWRGLRAAPKILRAPGCSDKNARGRKNSRPTAAAGNRSRASRARDGRLRRLGRTAAADE